MNNIMKVFLCAAVLCVALSTFGFISKLSDSPGQEQIPDKDERIAAMNAFQQRNVDISIRRHSSTGTPASLVGRITKYSGTPEQIARAFLTEEKTMLGILDPENDVAVTKTTQSKKSGSSVHFEQRYNSVPVLKAGYVVAMDNTGAIYYVGGDWYPEASVETNPNITESQAASVINGDLAGKQPNMKQEPTLSILQETLTKGEIQYRLIYKARVSAMDESWMYYISALDGSIVEKIDMLMDINGQGKVYETNPLYGGITIETLHRLVDQTPRLLDGDNVIVYNDATSEASSVTGQFFYDPDDTHFDEVMVYHHVDKFTEGFLQGVIGMSVSYPGYKIPAHTHITNYNKYAYFDPNDEDLNFNDETNSIGYGNPTKDSDVITHEFMHAVSWAYTTDWFYDLEARAMNEAYSDYFSVGYKNWVLDTTVTIHTTGEYVNTPYVRILDNSYIYPDDFGPSYHFNSQIFSGALWDLRRDPDISSTTHIDEMTLESLDNIDSSPSFLDVLDWMIGYAQTYHETYVDDIVDAFYAHGIYIPPLTVEIDGWHIPYAYFQWENSWWAEVSSGDPPYNTYAWSMRVQDSEDEENWSDWESVGSDSIYNLEEDDWEYFYEELFAGYNLDVGSNIQLKVVVTDNAPESEEEIIGLEVTDPQKKIAAEQLPKNFKLEQNYPNPFNPVTTIKFQLPKASNVTLVIYNIQGQEVARLVDGYVEAGYHSVNWDASNAASGIYIYRLQSRLSGFSDTKRMLYIK